MKPAYQTVIFDIDGTLLKSDRGVMNALKYTTEKMGVPYPSAEIRQKFVRLSAEHELQILGFRD